MSFRSRFWIFFLKWARLEFWPASLFYIPLVFYGIFLVLRYRGFLWISACNPGIWGGGIAGESKSEILGLGNQIPVAPYRLLQPPIDKTTNLREHWEREWDVGFSELGLSFPCILKPDKGERGAGVFLVHTKEKAIELLVQYSVDTILQTYIPGPYEAGIFYMRYPNASHGFIFSITDKVFPLIHGDGVSTLEELIWAHPRFRFQAKTFLSRFSHQKEKILSLGETKKLGFGGNHVQGCLFQDGSEWITPELSRSIDSISQSISGFFFGRYDIRYSSLDDLKKGKNFWIIEINGAMSESTNLYDPRFSIFQSYRILFNQWKHLFAIGKANALLGAPCLSWKELYQMLKSHSNYKTQIATISQEI